MRKAVTAVRKWGFRLLWSVLSCALIVSSLLMVRGYAPLSTPSADHAPTVTVPTAPTTSTPTDEPAPLPDNPVDFAALQAEYPEAVAWITVPNTKINYVVMQSGPDTEEDFYLTHNEAGKKDSSGSIYIQRYNRADFSDPNTVLYGHNMKGGKMFANVHLFKDKEFLEENEYLYIYTPGHVLKYRIYSLFSWEVRNDRGKIKHLLWAYDFDTEAGYREFLDKTTDPNTRIKRVREGVAPTTDDKVVTLSTCISGQNNTGRLLLVAVLEEDTLTK